MKKTNLALANKVTHVNEIMNSKEAYIDYESNLYDAIGSFEATNKDPDGVDVDGPSYSRLPVTVDTSVFGLNEGIMKFRSILAACKYLHLNVGTAYMRMHRMKEEALANGEEFDREAAANKVFETPFHVYQQYVQGNNTERIEAAMELPENEVFDHHNIPYKNFHVLAAVYDLPERLIKERLYLLNWDPELALTEPPVWGRKFQDRVRYRDRQKLYRDHTLRPFPTKTAMCAYHHISVNLFNERRKAEWTVRDALLTPASAKMDKSRIPLKHRAFDTHTTVVGNKIAVQTTLISQVGFIPATK